MQSYLLDQPVVRTFSPQVEHLLEQLAPHHIVSQIDMSTWEPGPWQSEPDLVEWLDAVSGYRCQASRHPYFGTWCGYIAVESEHPLYGLSYSDSIEMLTDDVQTDENPSWMGLFLWAMNPERQEGRVPLDVALQCHHGLTFADRSTPADQFYLQRSEDQLWWFGFDCNHGEDRAPHKEGVPAILCDMFGNGEYRTLDYVVSQCDHLAGQLLRLG